VEKAACKTASPMRLWLANDAPRSNPIPPTAGRFADSLWDRFVAQLNIQQPTRNIQYARKENASLRFTRVETAKKKMSGNTSRVGYWIFLVGYWKFLVGCWILKKWFLSNDRSGSWKKSPAKRLAPCGYGWPTMHQGPTQSPRRLAVLQPLEEGSALPGNAW